MNVKNYGCQNKHGQQYVRRSGLQPKQGGQRPLLTAHKVPGLDPGAGPDPFIRSFHSERRELARELIIRDTARRKRAPRGYQAGKLEKRHADASSSSLAYDGDFGRRDPLMLFGK